MGPLFVALCASSLAAYRAPQPPSLPPHQALGTEAPIEHAKLHFEYEWSMGFIGAGGDVHQPLLCTVSDALSRCDADARCRGITYEGAKNDTSAPQKCYFKMSDRVEHADGWSSWTKRSPVLPPALTVSVGGTSKLELRLRQDFFTIQNLSRVGDRWSFTRPLDDSSSLPMCAHAGDLSLRLRSAGSDAWTLYSTISLGAVAKPLKIPTGTRPPQGGDISGTGTGTGTTSTGQLLAAQDITALLDSSAPRGGPSLPLTVVRSYQRSADGEALLLKFNLTSTSATAIEIGGLGMALPESPGHPPAGIETVVWNDPHIGGEHGFVEFVRVVDDEATLLVTADRPKSSPLEAWRPMLEDLGGGDAYEWTIASKAWAAEWAKNTQFPFLNMSSQLRREYPAFARDPIMTPWPSTDGKHPVPIVAECPVAAAGGNSAANPWNTPTSMTLMPGESISVGLRFQLAAGGPRTRDTTLTKMGIAVLHAVPGYVLPTNLKSAALLVKPPAGSKVVSVRADDPPAGVSASLVFERTSDHELDAPSQFVRFRVAAGGYGRLRVRIAFSDGTTAVAHYFVVPAFDAQVATLGVHWADVSWLPRDYPDPFGRSASVMPWDRSVCGSGSTPCGHVLNDARAYDAGLSDDAGGGNPLGFASKVRAAPTAHEAARIDEFIRWTLYGVKPDVAKPPLKSLQIREEEAAAGTVGAESVDGIRMTMFYYAHDLNDNSSGHFPWNYTEADKCHKPFGGPTWCMTENMANATYRGFNYPHQIASYWAMYTVSRFTNLPTRKPWHWYLHRAVKTALMLGRAGVGFMDGTVVREVLLLCQAEGAAGNVTFATLAKTLEANMRARQLTFASKPYPYGSEFGFDTTGQEEVVVWNLFFGNESVAKKTVDHILSYMRNSPTWAYHGGSRSWGDVENNGKYLMTFGTRTADRGQMHYRSGLNMIPLIEWYRRHPEEGTYLLEIAMGAISGQMTNIDPKTGATSMMFHAAPHALTHDPHSGDFGLGFFGNALESGAYYVCDPELGTLCFLCDITDAEAGDHARTRIALRDAYRIAIYIEPLGLYITSQCGTISAVEIPKVAAATYILVAFDKASHCDKRRLQLSKTAKARPGQSFRVEGANLVRGAFEMDVNASEVVRIIFRL